MKKLKEKTPYLDLQNQLLTNTCIFKENLKLITNSLIDSIWKEKMKGDRIKDTIQSAICEIYRGNFDVIKELDEEQLYNSWIKSGENTERILSENNLSALHKNLSGRNTSPKNVSAFEDNYEDKPELLVSDIYDKEKKEEITQNLIQKIPINEINLIQSQNGSENSIDDDYQRKKESFEKLDFTKKARIHNAESIICVDEGFKQEQHNSTPPLDTENDHNMSNSSDKLFHQDKKGEGTQIKKIKKAHSKSIFRDTNANHNSNKLKNITKNSHYNPRKLKSFNKFSSSTRDLNIHKTYIAKEPAITNLNGSFKKETLARHSNGYNSKDIFNNGIKKILKKTNYNFKTKYPLSRPHERNKSASLINNMKSYEDQGSFKYDYGRTKNRREKVNRHATLTLKNNKLTNKG